MIITLVFSAILSTLILLVVGDAISPHDSSTAMLIRIAIVLACGYHRTIVSSRGRVAWRRLKVPSEATAFVRNTLWGLPISPARKVRVSANTQSQVHKGSLRPRLRQLLPTWLSWLVS